MDWGSSTADKAHVILHKYEYNNSTCTVPSMCTVLFQNLGYLLRLPYHHDTITTPVVFRTHGCNATTTADTGRKVYALMPETI